MQLLQTTPCFWCSYTSLKMQVSSHTRCSGAALPARIKAGPKAVAAAAAPRLWQQHRHASRQRLAACKDCRTGSLDEGTPKGEESVIAGVSCYIRCVGTHPVLLLVVYCVLLSTVTTANVLTFALTILASTSHKLTGPFKLLPVSGYIACSVLLQPAVLPTWLCHHSSDRHLRLQTGQLEVQLLCYVFDHSHRY